VDSTKVDTNKEDTFYSLKIMTMPMQNQYHYISQFEIDKEAEQNSWHIRFNDLRPEAQQRFIKGLKKFSTVYTLRTDAAKEEDMLNVTRDLNPILINTGWRGSFSMSNFFQWKQQILSSAIFNSMFRSAPRSMHQYSKRAMFDTPRDAIRITHPRFVCRACGVQHDRDDEDYWCNDTCRDCVRDRNNYAKRN